MFFQLHNFYLEIVKNVCHMNEKNLQIMTEGVSYEKFHREGLASDTLMMTWSAKLLETKESEE